MKGLFYRIHTAEELGRACGINQHLIFDKEWEASIKKSLPYINFEHYIYKNSFLVRVVRIGNRMTTTPFFDLGDVFPLADKNLVSPRELKDDLESFFGFSVPIRIHTGVCPVDPTSTFSTQIKDSMILLDDSETMLSSFRKTTRHLLHDAEKDDAYISQVQNEEELKKTYVLYLRNIRRVANFTVPYSLFKYTYNSEDCDFWVWKRGDEVHAFVLFLRADTACHYSLSAFSVLGKKQHASHKLLWYVMRFYHKQGIKKMFLGPTREGTKLWIFKRGWRGEEYPIITLNEGTGGGKMTTLFRPLWSLIPLFLLPKATKIAGKYLF